MTRAYAVLTRSTYEERTGPNGIRLAQRMFHATGAPEEETRSWMNGKGAGEWAARLLSDSTLQPAPEDHLSEGTNRLITFVGERLTRTIAFMIPAYPPRC